MRIVHLTIEGRVNEVVVVYKDRLTRFGYELIENLIEIFKGKDNNNGEEEEYRTSGGIDGGHNADDECICGKNEWVEEI